MGHTDIPLNELGRKQAMRAAERLSELKIDQIYASDLSRAEETAQIISDAHNMLPIVEPELREIFLGDLQGLQTSEVRERYPEAGLIPSGTDLAALGLVEDKESRAQLYLRTVRIFDQITTKHHGESIILVTHGGVLRCLLNHVLHMNSNSDESLFYSYAINSYNCSISLIERGKNEKFEIGYINDYSHLEGLETKFE